MRAAASFVLKRNDGIDAGCTASRYQAEDGGNTRQQHGHEQQNHPLAGLPRKGVCKNARRQTGCCRVFEFIGGTTEVVVPDLTVNSFIQHGRVALDPAPDRDVVHCQAPLRHDLLKVAVCERIPQIPAKAQKDYSSSKCRPRNSAGRLPGTVTPYQISSIAFATEPLKL
jgi:hypothetical protein